MAKSNHVTWEEPPEGGALRRNLTSFHPFVLELKANPGRWARHDTYANQQRAQKTASMINTGMNKWNQPARSFEAVVRHIDGQSVVYIRYVGDGGAR